MKIVLLIVLARSGFHPAIYFHHRCYIAINYYFIFIIIIFSITPYANIGSRNTERHGKISRISKAGYNVRYCPYTKGTVRLAMKSLVVMFIINKHFLLCKIL